MNPNQLKETTVDPATRSMLRVTLPQEYEERHQVKDPVDRLMGKHPEHRFPFIQANAAPPDAAAIDACQQNFRVPVRQSTPRRTTGHATRKMGHSHGRSPETRR